MIDGSFILKLNIIFEARLRIGNFIDTAIFDFPLLGVFRLLVKDSSEN
jgi:hypothetical protein